MPLFFEPRAALSAHFDALVPDGHKDFLSYVLFRSRDYGSLPDHRRAKVRDYAVGNMAPEAIESNFERIEPKFRAGLSELLSQIGAGSDFEPVSEKFFDDAVEHYKKNCGECSSAAPAASVLVPLALRFAFLQKHGLDGCSDGELSQILSAYLRYRLFYRLCPSSR